jgi:hypothetical protein
MCYSVGIYTDNELGAMVDRMESAKLRTVNLTDNDLAKDHLRYFVCCISCTNSYYHIIFKRNQL